MARAVTDRDKGYNDLRRALAAVGRIRVVVGIRGAKGSEKGARTRKGADGSETTTADSIDLVGIAAVHEYGTTNGHVPARPYLGPTVDNNRSKYMQELESAVGNAIDGDTDIDTGLGILGLRVVRDTQQTINVMTDPPLAERTIAEKGSSALLIDQGRLIQSIDSEVRRG